MAGDFYDIMLCCYIYLMEVLFSYPFCSTYLSMVVPSSLEELLCIVSCENPAPFCLGCRNWRLLALSLDFYVVMRVWIFLSS